MSWQADYNLVVSDKSNAKTDILDMIGWITMQNHSGKTFENAHQAARRGCKQNPVAERCWPHVCCGKNGGR